MANNFLGPNERRIIEVIQDGSIGDGVGRREIVDLIFYSKGNETSRESLYRSINNMCDKGMLLYNPITNRVEIPDQWTKAFKLGKTTINFTPQQLIPAVKRMEVLVAAARNVKLTEQEQYGLYLLLDLSIDNIKDMFQMFKEVDAEKKNDFDELVNLYFNRK